MLLGRFALACDVCIQPFYIGEEMVTVADLLFWSELIPVSIFLADLVCGLISLRIADIGF